MVGYKACPTAASTSTQHVSRQAYTVAYSTEDTEEEIYHVHITEMRQPECAHRLGAIMAPLQTKEDGCSGENKQETQPQKLEYSDAVRTGLLSVPPGARTPGI